MPEGTVRRPLDSYASAARCTRPAARNAEIGRLHDLTCELKNRVAHHVYTKAALARLRSGSISSAGARNRYGRSLGAMRAVPCAFFEPSRGRGEIGTLCQFSWFLSSGLQGPYFCGCQTARTEEVK